jgi:hypothetical protein
VDKKVREVISAETCGVQSAVVKDIEQSDFVPVREKVHQDSKGAGQHLQEVVDTRAIRDHP